MTTSAPLEDSPVNDDDFDLVDVINHAQDHEDHSSTITRLGLTVEEWKSVLEHNVAEILPAVTDHSIIVDMKQSAERMREDRKAAAKSALQQFSGVDDNELQVRAECRGNSNEDRVKEQERIRDEYIKQARWFRD